MGVLVIYALVGYFFGTNFNAHFNMNMYVIWHVKARNMSKEDNMTYMFILKCALKLVPKKYPIL